MLTWARRFSAAVLLLGAAPSGLGPGASGDAARPPGTLVTVAEVSAHRALLWVRAPDGAPVAIRYGAAGALTMVTEATPSAARDFTARVVLERLWAGTRYQYDVRTAGERVTGTFTTAPAADADTPVRLAWSGDLGGAGHCRDAEDGYRIFRAMTARAPDAFLFVGDTIYADHRCGRAQLAGADYTQRRWLLDGVSASDATWKLIVSSVPLGIFTGGAHSDSWSNANVFGYPREGTGFVHERDLILKSLHERGAGNVVFVSGDVHHAEILRHEPMPGFVLHELIAGPLAARRGYPRFLDRSLGSRSLGSLGWAHNFGEIVADGAGLRVNIVDSAGTVRVSRRLPAERRAMPL